MNEATTKLIGELAAKLGVTVDHLWGVLVRQAPISGVCDVLVIIAWIVGLAWGLRRVRSKTTDPKCGYDGAEFAWVVWGIAAALAIYVVSVAFSEIVASFVNPEYWALKQVLPR